MAADLSDQDIVLLARWVAADAVEAVLSDLSHEDYPALSEAQMQRLYDELHVELMRHYTRFPQGDGLRRILRAADDWEASQGGAP